ncbi:MAG: ATP-binding protein [Candidatus Marinimicrobia bacterium]|nr:ATP-binding protein [Candidatus Neomarinimicrobiota bacterium]
MKWSTLAEKTHQELKRRSLLQKRERLLVAFSGGLDSTVLLHVLLELRPYWKWELSAGHVDHGLRPGCDEKEALFCRELAEKHGIPYYEKKLHLNDPEAGETYAPGGSQTPGPEALAREARYRVLGTWAKSGAIRMPCRERTSVPATRRKPCLAACLPERDCGGSAGSLRKRRIFRRPFLPGAAPGAGGVCRTHRDLKHCEDLSNRDETIVRNQIPARG